MAPCRFLFWEMWMAEQSLPADIPAAIGPYRNRVVGLRVMPAGDYWTG